MSDFSVGDFFSTTFFFFSAERFCRGAFCVSDVVSSDTLPGRFFGRDCCFFFFVYRYLPELCYFCRFQFAGHCAVRFLRCLDFKT